MELQKSELLVVANGAMVLANQIRDKAVNDAIVEYRAKWYNRILSRNLSDKEIKAKIYKSRGSKEFYKFMGAVLIVEEIRLLAQKYIDIANAVSKGQIVHVCADEFLQLKRSMG